MNAETKHTPGPWKYDGMWSLVMAGKYEIAAIHAARFAEDTKKRKRLDESQANARLIAAAPDLLEACKEALLWIETPTRPWAATADLIRAAIQKAESQS